MSTEGMMAIKRDRSLSGNPGYFFVKRLGEHPVKSVKCIAVIKPCVLI